MLAVLFKKLQLPTNQMDKYTNLQLLNELAHIVISESHLEEREKKIIEMRLQGYTYLEIGKEFRVTQCRIRIITMKAMQKIQDRRSMLESDIKNALLSTAKIVFECNECNDVCTPLETLSLSTRTLRSLIRNGVGSVQALVVCSESQLSNFRGIGANAIDEISSALWGLGYGLLQDNPPKKTNYWL